MSVDFFTLMKSELSLILIIFLLLFLKVWDGIESNKTLLNGINVLLFVNFVIGFFDYPAGSLFGGMFNHNSILNTEKFILNFGTLIISLQAYDWVKNHKHLLEFYILMISTLLGNSVKKSIISFTLKSLSNPSISTKSTAVSVFKYRLLTS